MNPEILQEFWCPGINGHYTGSRCMTSMVKPWPKHIQVINSEFSNTKNVSAECEYSLVTKNWQP